MPLVIHALGEDTHTQTNAFRETPGLKALPEHIIGTSTHALSGIDIKVPGS